MIAKEKVNVVVWKCTHLNITEFTTIAFNEKIKVNGQITGQGFGKFLNVNYQLDISNQWEVQAVKICLQSDISFTISLHKTTNNDWINERGEILTLLNNCIDIDISITPFTNTLPINRLNLRIGESKDIEVVYFNLPTNNFSPVKQRYTNFGNGSYNYENLTSGFSTNLQVDNEGLVLNYPGKWQRLFNENQSTSK